MPVFILKGGPFDGAKLELDDPAIKIPSSLHFDKNGVCKTTTSKHQDLVLFLGRSLTNAPAEQSVAAQFPPHVKQVCYQPIDQDCDSELVEFEFRPPSVLEIKVALFCTSSVPITRSEAKRLPKDIGTPVRIVLDFEGILDIGRSFADEIFRVWENEHLDSIVTYSNASAEVEAMIRVARTEKWHGTV